MIEVSSYEQVTIVLVNPVVQREQAAPLPHQGRGLLVNEGERHKRLVPLERVEGV